MIPAIALFLSSAALIQGNAYAGPAEAELIAQARARHLAQDTLVRDYRAVVRSRIDLALGKSRFARLVPLVAAEHVSQIAWALPNDLRVEFVGHRQRMRFPTDVNSDVRFDRPWFIPRSLSDSVRLLDDALPERAALHPLARNAEQFYHYAIVDSVALVLPARTIEVIAVDVRPQELGPALVAGRMYLDRSTGDVVRFTFLLLGEYLWEQPDVPTPKDSARARKNNRIASKVMRVEADIEYSLFEQKYWMPYRQLVTLNIHDPWFTDAVIPIRFVSEFGDYEINTGRAIAFSLELPDGDKEVTRVDSTTLPADRAVTRAGRSSNGGRWEMVTPSRDSLKRYAGWRDSLALDPEPGDDRRLREMRDELARLAEDLPAAWVGRGGLGIARAAEILRFNRVQGLSLGAAYRWEPNLRFTRLFVAGRFGLGDQRVYATASVLRDGPSGQWELRVGRELRDTDPWSRGSSMANSFNAATTGHDDANYMLVDGLSLGLARPLGRRTEWRWRVGAENHQSVGRDAGSAIHDLFFGDGEFQVNPPVRERFAAVAHTEVDYHGDRLQWRLGVDGHADHERAAARFWSAARARFGPVTAGLVAGAATRDDVPQMLLAAGGPATVRGYDFAARRGAAMWAAQLELVLRPRQFLRPVLFADVGNAAPLGDLLGSSQMIGIGGGLSLNLILTELRLELAKAIAAGNDEAVRFDIRFMSPR